VPYGPNLAYGGPFLASVREKHRYGAVADLTVEGDYPDCELLVNPIAGEQAELEVALTEWAGLTGYKRLWFPDSVVTLDSLPDGAARAETTCGHCGAHWDDGGDAFWLAMREMGSFPGCCYLCGVPMPQWRPAETGGRASEQSWAERPADLEPAAAERPPGPAGPDNDADRNGDDDELPE
jgi:hypothetical protein